MLALPRSCNDNDKDMHGGVLVKLTHYGESGSTQTIKVRIESSWKPSRSERRSGRGNLRRTYDTSDTPKTAERGKQSQSLPVFLVLDDRKLT